MMLVLLILLLIITLFFPVFVELVGRGMNSFHFGHKKSGKVLKVP
jgi:hypothetical protein